MSDLRKDPVLVGEIVRHKRFHFDPKMRKKIVAMSGNQCAFPDCDQDLLLDGEIFIGEIVSIEPLSQAGPRFNPDTDPARLMMPENFLLLCPNHHKIIDRSPEKYTINWLKNAREDHLSKIRSAISKGATQPEVKLKPQVEVSLQEALKIWGKSKENKSEEFWQKLFEQCPSVIAQLIPRSTFQIGSKSYVGGKSISNSGGNLVDFIYASKTTNNVVLVEIKTPKTRLIGKRYRSNAYCMSEDLTGSIVQVLNYRDSLTKEYYTLSKDDATFDAFSPRCIVIAGSVDVEMDNPTKMKSFELFRNECSGVDVITFDELFDKAQSVLDITTNAAEQGSECNC